MHEAERRRADEHKALLEDYALMARAALALAEASAEASIELGSVTQELTATAGIRYEDAIESVE